MIFIYTCMHIIIYTCMHIIIYTCIHIIIFYSCYVVGVHDGRKIAVDERGGADI